MRNEEQSTIEASDAGLDLVALIPRKPRAIETMVWSAAGVGGSRGAGGRGARPGQEAGGGSAEAQLRLG
jgi:hypothetical protein